MTRPYRPVTDDDLEAICAVIEQGARLGWYTGTPAGDAYLRLPSWLMDRLCERQNEKTERILAQAKECQGHKHSPTNGGEKCPWCGRFRVPASPAESGPSGTAK